MAASGEEIVRRAIEVFQSSESVDVAMAALEPLLHPEIEWVNPDYALETGTRTGLAGIRIVLESFYTVAGSMAPGELEEVESRGDRVFTVARFQARGDFSGAEIAGRPTAIIWTVRDGRISRIAWHYDIDETRRRFERATRA